MTHSHNEFQRSSPVNESSHPSSSVQSVRAFPYPPWLCIQEELYPHSIRNQKNLLFLFYPLIFLRRGLWTTKIQKFSPKNPLKLKTEIHASGYTTFESWEMPVRLVLSTQFTSSWLHDRQFIIMNEYNADKKCRTYLHRKIRKCWLSLFWLIERFVSYIGDSKELNPGARA